MPSFKKKTVSKRKKPKVIREKKTYTPFPPAPTPSKIDLQLESGEYFLNESQREDQKRAEKRKASKEKSDLKIQERSSIFAPPGKKSKSE